MKEIGVVPSFNVLEFAGNEDYFKKTIGNGKLKKMHTDGDQKNAKGNYGIILNNSYKLGFRNFHLLQPTVLQNSNLLKLRHSAIKCKIKLKTRFRICFRN